jgi:hypothetical protein
VNQILIDPRSPAKTANQRRGERCADFCRGALTRSRRNETLRKFRDRARSLTLLFAIAIAFLVSHFSTTATVNAQENPEQLKPSLRLELRNQQTVRTGGPLPVTFDLVWDGVNATLLEGQLQLLLSDGIEVYGRYVLSDLAINPGTTTYRILLPSLEGRAAFQTVDLVAKFVTVNGDEFDLEARPLRIVPDVSRFFRVMYCDPVSSTDDRRVSKFLNSLKFEQFLPTPARGDLQSGPENSVVTMFDSQRPSDMLSDPHWFCPISLAVISRNGFSELRSRQLEVLLQWVKAGGSLVVEPLGSLDDAHLEFLNSLGSESPESELVVDERGQVSLPNDRRLDFLTCGLGKAAVLYAGIQDDFDTAAPDWQQAVAGLWHFRKDQREAVESNGKSIHLSETELYPDNAGQPHRARHTPYYNQLYQQNLTGMQQHNLSVRPIQSVQGLLERLMPRDVEVVPLPYIGAILLLYLLTIGPVDYFVLGMFKARRLTWITFPLATVGFTLFTVWLSNAYLSSSAERTFVQILDIARDGDVTRSNRLELLFTMSSSNVTTEVKSGIFTALDHSRFGGTIHDAYQRQVHRRTVPAPTIVGRPPGTFSAVQAVPKWTPQINRILQIAPDPELLPAELKSFDWSSPRDLRTEDGLAQLRQEIRDNFGNAAIAVLFHGRKSTDLIGSRLSVFQEAMVRQLQQNGTVNNGNQWLYTDFLWDASVRLQGTGLFNTICRIAPHGGANFEDLTLLDPSDPNQWLLVIAIPDAEDMTIYRRLYQLPPTSADAQATPPADATNDESDAQAGPGEVLLRGQ